MYALAFKQCIHNALETNTYRSTQLVLSTTEKNHAHAGIVSGCACVNDQHPRSKSLRESVKYRVSTCLDLANLFGHSSSAAQISPPPPSEMVTGIPTFDTVQRKGIDTTGP